MPQHLFGIAKLRHQVGIAQIGHLDIAATGKYQFFSIKRLGPGGNKLLQVLKSVPDGDVADGYFLGILGNIFQ